HRRAVAPAPGPPARLPQPARRRPPRPGCHLLRPPHRPPRERPERHRPRLPQLGPPPLPGVGRRRGLPPALAARAHRVRRAQGDQGAVAGDGRGDDQGPTRRGNRPGRTRPTGASWAPSGAPSPTRPGSRSAWPSPGPTARATSARETLESLPVERPGPTPAAPQGLCLDQGCDGAVACALAAELGYEPP